MARGSWRILATALVGLVTMGSASADPSADPGGIEIPRGSDLEATWEVLFCGSIGHGDDWILNSPAAYVEEHARTRFGGAALQAYTERSVRSYRLTNLTLEVVEPEGWVGISAGAGASLTTSLAREVTLAAMAPRVVGNWREGSTPAERVSAFAHHVQRTSLGWEAPFSGRMEGDLVLKAYGPSITLHAQENKTLVRTGPEDTAQGLAATERWLVVRLGGAAGSARIESPCIFAAERAWVKAAAPLLMPASTLESEGKTSDDVFPPGSRVEFSVEGDALAARAAGRVAPAPAVPWMGGVNGKGLTWLVASAIGLATVVGASILLASRRPSKGSISAEACAYLAEIAAEERRFQEALHWTRQGLERAPSSNRLRMDEAWFLWELGRAKEAFAAAEDAAAKGRDGEAAFLAAILFARAGEDARAVRHLLTALEQDPDLVVEAREEPAFEGLKTEARVRRLLQAR